MYYLVRTRYQQFITEREVTANELIEMFPNTLPVVVISIIEQLTLTIMAIAIILAFIKNILDKIVKIWRGEYG